MSKCQEQEVLLYQKVAACTSEACDFKLWTTIAKKKLTATQLKEIIQNSRTSQPVKGLKGQKGSFEATIVLKEDFTTGFEFSEKKKRTLRKEHDALQNNGGFILCEIQHTNNKKSKIKKAKIRSEQEKLRANRRRLQQLKNQQRIQKEIELDR